MYYSDVSGTVRRLRVYAEGQRPSHVFPPHAVRASCGAPPPPKPPSAGVNELSMVHAEQDSDMSGPVGPHLLVSP